jgi:nucleoside-diphosphate-sugar epimerase
VTLHHPDGSPVYRDVMAAENCVQAFVFALKTKNTEGQTFMSAVNAPLSYIEAAKRAAGRLGSGSLEWSDPVGNDLWSDPAKAKSMLGYGPTCDNSDLMDKAVRVRQSGRPRRRRSGPRR